MLILCKPWNIEIIKGVIVFTDSMTLDSFTPGQVSSIPSWIEVPPTARFNQWSIY